MMRKLEPTKKHYTRFTLTVDRQTKNPEFPGGNWSITRARPENWLDRLAAWLDAKLKPMAVTARLQEPGMAPGLSLGVRLTHGQYETLMGGQTVMTISCNCGGETFEANSDLAQAATEDAVELQLITPDDNMMEPAGGLV